MEEFSEAERPAAEEALTAREREVLELIARGLPNKLIARELDIAEKTVKTHVSSILSKLGLTDRTQAALYAVRAGLVESTEVLGPIPDGGGRPRRLASASMTSTAIVTGASRGLGLELTKALAQRGWRVVIDARDLPSVPRGELAESGRWSRWRATSPTRRTARALVEAAGGAHRPARQQRKRARPEPAAAARATSRSRRSSGSCG